MYIYSVDLFESALFEKLKLGIIDCINDRIRNGKPLSRFSFARSGIVTNVRRQSSHGISESEKKREARRERLISFRGIDETEVSYA